MSDMSRTQGGLPKLLEACVPEHHPIFTSDVRDEMGTSADPT